MLERDAAIVPRNRVDWTGFARRRDERGGGEKGSNLAFLGAHPGADKKAYWDWRHSQHQSGTPTPYALAKCVKPGGFGTAFWIK